MPRLANPPRPAPPSLPDYQPPLCPLSATARRALDELCSSRGAALLDAQLKDAARGLGFAVSDLHERLRAQLERLDALRDRRRDRAADRSPEEARLDAHLAAWEPAADRLTRDAELALRHVVDMRAELEDEAAVLADLYTDAATRDTHAAAARRRRRTDHAADDDADADAGEAPADALADAPAQDPVPSTLDALRERCARKLAEYNRLTPHQRYALNNDYAGFKKLWHDAAAGEHGPPLPDASKWFRSNGQPVMDRPGAATDGDDDDNGGGDDDDDDDIAVEREVLSLNCPLTLRVMEEPYSNTKCKHTFEKAAILDYLPRQGVVQCPQTGCSQTFSRARFAQDFYLDQAMLRRIQRANRAQGDGDELGDEDADEEGEGGSEMVVRGQRSVRGAPKAEKA